MLLSCKKKLAHESITKTVFPEVNSWRDHWENPKQKAQLLANPNIHERIKACLKDTTIVVLTASLLEDLERYAVTKPIGDINNDGVNDSIMIIPELYITKEQGIEDGASAIFTDKNLPRIRVDVSCLEAHYFFPVADINDDGITELGQYYTSCASRFKGLKLISLDQGKWKTKGQVIFDVFYEEPKKEKRIEKVGTNKFRMREITAENTDRIIDIWKTFEMK